MLIKLIFFCALLSQNLSAEEQEIDASHSNHILIEGKRKESRRPDRAGTSLILTPQNESRFDAKALLKSEASLLFPDSGKFTASGFNLPRIRGQDPRLTELYIDGLKVQDPYTGIAVIDDIDLRAFGELALYLGNPPPHFPSMHGGIVSYQFRDQKDQLGKIGSQSGKPYGQALWGLFSSRIDHKHHTLRIYMREYWTKGDFPYYDDNLTPYNTSDDKIAIRKHNDRHAQEFIPSFRLRFGPHQFSGLLLWNQSKSSIPARMSGQESQARQKNREGIGKIAYRYYFESGQAFFFPRQLSLELGSYDDHAQLTDPTQVILSSASELKRESVAKVISVEALWQNPDQLQSSTGLLRAESAKIDGAMESQERLQYRYRRNQQTLYSGISYPITEVILCELKAQIQLQSNILESNQDQALSTSSKKNVVTEKLLPAESAAWSWHPGIFNFYLQIAKTKRAASLMEEFGDGRFIRENLGLRPESLFHKEIGMGLKAEELSSLIHKTRLHLAYFQDQTFDKIVMLPSIGQTLRAQNMRETEISGLETGLGAQLKYLGLDLAYTHLQAYDRSYTGKSRMIVGVPQHVAVGSLSYQVLPSSVWRAISRYQSQVWRDLDNSIAIPASFIHDTSFDISWSRFDLGITISNIFNQQKSAIFTKGLNGSKGYTSYSDYAGWPLPGRQFRINLSSSF